MATVHIQKREGKTGIRYVVRYRDPMSGKKKHFKSFKRMRDAQQSANDLRALLDTGRIPQKNVKYRAMTFSEVGEELRKDWDELEALGELRAKTLLDYRYRLKRLEAVFGTILVGQLTEGLIIEHRNERAKKHSNVTANKDLKIIRKVIKKGGPTGIAL